jgi:hypothetical protein
MADMVRDRGGVSVFGEKVAIVQGTMVMVNGLVVI